MELGNIETKCSLISYYVRLETCQITW